MRPFQMRWPRRRAAARRLGLLLLSACSVQPQTVAAAGAHPYHEDAVCEPFLVDRGNPYEACGLQGGRDVEGSQECTEAIAAEFHDRFQHHEDPFVKASSPQNESNRPHGCWWQASNNHLFFNEASSPETCTSHRLCVCCRNSTVSDDQHEATLAACSPELVIAGVSDGELCVQTVEDEHDCMYVARRHPDIPEGVSALSQHVADRPTGCWWQPGDPGLLFFNHQQNTVACSEHRQCLCCSGSSNETTTSAATAAPAPANFEACTELVTGGPPAIVCAQQGASREDCLMAFEAVPELHSKEHHGKVFYLWTDKFPPGCSLDVEGGHAVFNSKASAATCDGQHPCLCCPGPGAKAYELPPETTTAATTQTTTTIFALLSYRLLVEGLDCTLLKANASLEAAVALQIQAEVLLVLSNLSAQREDRHNRSCNCSTDMEVAVDLICGSLIAEITVFGSGDSFSNLTDARHTVELHLRENLAASISQVSGIAAAQVGLIAVGDVGVAVPQEQDMVASRYEGSFIGSIMAANTKLIAFVGLGLLSFGVCLCCFIRAIRCCCCRGKKAPVGEAAGHESAADTARGEEWETSSKVEPVSPRLLGDLPDWEFSGLKGACEDWGIDQPTHLQAFREHDADQASQSLRVLCGGFACCDSGPATDSTEQPPRQPPPPPQIWEVHI